MTLIVDVFPKLRTSKGVVRSMSIKSRFRGLFKKQHSKRAQILLKSEQQHLYHIYRFNGNAIEMQKVSYVSDMQKLKTVC